MAGIADYRYDVAFSFLDRDESLAREMAALLAPRTSFVYTEQQAELAGRDGVDAFTAVFRRDARIVAILYRDAWGKTKWTRIEEEAIKSRFLEDGAEFVTLIKVDGARPPDWFPVVRIWVDLDRFGPAGAAGVLDERVRAARGAVRAETPQENAARLDRERQAEAERLAFLGSPDGVEAADQDVERLFGRLESVSSETGIAFDREGSHCALLYRDGFSIAVGWSRMYGNTLDQSAVYLTEWKGRPNIGAKQFHSPNRKVIRSLQFRFDMGPDREPLWRTAKEPRLTFTVDRLAEYCISLLLERVRSSSRDG
jgi:hypothetical protein